MLIDELVSNKSTAPTGRKNVGKLWLVLHEINCLYIFLLITVYTASQLLWDHSWFSPTVQHFLMLRGLFLCFRKKLGRGRQHEGGGRQDAEGVWEPERLNQRGAAVNWEQSVYHPLLTAWGNMIAFCLVTVIVHKIILNDFTILPLKYDKYDFMTLFLFLYVLLLFSIIFYCFFLCQMSQINSESSHIANPNHIRWFLCSTSVNIGLNVTAVTLFQSSCLASVGLTGNKHCAANHS